MPSAPNVVSGSTARGNERSFGHGRCCAGAKAAPGRRATPPQLREARIRTLGVSLIAIAAIVASLTVVRQRQDVARLAEGEKGPQITPATSRLDLDQLRAAGM